MTRADWGDPVLQEDTEAEVAAELARWASLVEAEALEACAHEQGRRKQKAKANRDEHDKTDLRSTSEGAAQWYKFHGQMQGHGSAERALLRQATALRRLAAGS